MSNDAPDGSAVLGSATNERLESFGDEPNERSADERNESSAAERLESFADEGMESAACADWDVVVIGAGPAGAFAAYKLASRFKRILLIDKSEFPRSKVCGCCLNSAAVDLLERNGLARVLSSSNAIPLQHLSLYTNGTTATVNLPKSYSLSRSRLDAELVEAAVNRGVTFLSNTTAEVLDVTNDQAPNKIDVSVLNTTYSARTVCLTNAHSSQTISARTVRLTNSHSSQTIRAKMVLVADGLNGRSLAKIPGFQFSVSADSRFGCGTIVEDAPDFYCSGRIYMACATEGYVGLVRLEDGRLDIAAALDREFCRVQGSTAKAAATILKRNHLPLPQSIFSSHWSGTESLTRRRKRIADNRIFVIGDSCGYAEPFTGEGIAWALASGAAVANLVSNEWSESLIDRWQTKHRQLIQARQNRSIMIARGLRNNTLRNLAMPLISALPAVASSLIRRITHPISPPSDAA